MALIRKVAQHENSWAWAYIEYSDENKNHFKILGGKEFATKDEAIEYSKGFEPFSYEWKEPEDIKIQRLIAEKQQLIHRLNEIETELKDYP